MEGRLRRERLYASIALYVIFNLFFFIIFDGLTLILISPLLLVK